MNRRYFNTIAGFIISISLAATSSCSSQERPPSTKSFPSITLLNRIAFENDKLDQPKFACGFLMLYKNDTLAVTAKHLLRVLKPEGMNAITFDGIVKQWSMFPLDKPDQSVEMDKLLNENKSEGIDEKSTYENDWLLFSIKQNRSQVKPLVVRSSPLSPKEKLYVVGWTRKMESGAQRVYEFEYLKTVGNKILLKELIVPEQFGGLSGAPVVDEQGNLVGLVSGKTEDPETGEKFFSPCSIQSVVSYLDKKAFKQ